MGRPKRQTQTLATQKQGKRVIIYLRVSTDEQKQHGYGLDVQRESCTKFADLVGYTVIDVLSDEGLSGTLPMSERPALQKAFTLCLTGHADIILSHAQDRYSRETSVFIAIRDAAIKAGISLWTVKENMNFATKETKFMGEIHAVIATKDHDDIVVRLMNGRRQRCKIDGLGNGPTPFGYKRVLSGDATHPTVTIEENEREAAIVRFILSERKQGTTFQEIADRLRYNQDAMRNGTWDWTPGKVETITRHTTLYTTGLRISNGVEASEKWPVLYNS